MCMFYTRVCLRAQSGAAANSPLRQTYKRKIYAFAAKTVMMQTRFGLNCVRKAKFAVSIRIVKYKIGKIYYVRVRGSAADGKE